MVSAYADSYHHLTGERGPQWWVGYARRGALGRWANPQPPPNDAIGRTWRFAAVSRAVAIFCQILRTTAKALQCRTRTSSARGGVKENIVNQNVLKYVAK